jgi:chorismate--pyruvate lyase
LKTLTAPSPTRARWLRRPIHSQPYTRWLIDSGSLTRRLQDVSSSFKVVPVRFSKGLANADEAYLLGLTSKRTALIREVQLHCNAKPRVFAHSVIPYTSMRGQWHRLGRLGSRPLGGTLFADPRVRRTPLEFRKLSRNHPLYYRAVHGFELKPDAIWARRSVFSLNSASILVTEIFLPQILSL